jgi:hypothetical protein
MSNCLNPFDSIQQLVSLSARALATKQSSTLPSVSGLLRGACHWAASCADPLARNDEISGATPIPIDSLGGLSFILEHIMNK